MGSLPFLSNFSLRKEFAGSGKPSGTRHEAGDVEREMNSVCFYSPSLCTNRTVVTNRADPFNAAVSQELNVHLHSLVEPAQSTNMWMILGVAQVQKLALCWDFELDAILLTSALCSLLSG